MDGIAAASCAVLLIAWVANAWLFVRYTDSSTWGFWLDDGAMCLEFYTHETPPSVAAHLGSPVDPWDHTPWVPDPLRGRYGVLRIDRVESIIGSGPDDSVISRLWGGLPCAGWNADGAFWYVELPHWLLLAAPVAWLLIRRRSRPRTSGMCVCGYDLTGNISGTCPECGVPLQPPRGGGTTPFAAATGERTPA